MLIGNKGIGGLVQTVGKIEPADITRHIEQGLRHAVGTHLSDIPEYHHVHDDGQYGLYQIPKRPQYGLLILHYDIALDKQLNQVAVPPDLTEVDMPQFLMWTDI